MSKSDVINDVYKHKQLVSQLMNIVICKLLERSLNHDNSKMEGVELEIFNQFSPLLAKSTYGSDEYSNMLKEMGVGLDHHYANNRHHPEHYPDGIMGMDLVDLVEMICDWTASASRHNDGNILMSIDKNQERFHYSDELAQIFKNTVKRFE